MQFKDFRGEVWTNTHPEIINEMLKINDDIVDGNNGNDYHSLNATALMQKNFKEPIYTTYTISGTAANIIALKAMVDSWSTIICAEQAHINTYECGACEYTLGNKILSIECPDGGKLTPDLVNKVLVSNKKYKYHPKVVVITQPTEYGVVYSIDELKALSKYVHDNGMYLYIDGARLANALVALNSSIKEMIEDTDIDVFSFGGTKAGAMFGEMVVFRRKEFAINLDYIQKQSMQHLDKSKFLGVQIEYILETELWKVNAIKSNDAAKYLETRLIEKGIKMYYPVQTNMVFAILEEDVLNRITKKFDLHYWDVFNKSVRIATTYLTTKEKIDELVELI